MEKRIALVAVLAAAVAAPTVARAGDKALSNMLNPVDLSVQAADTARLAGPVSTAFTNGTSKGKFKFGDNCKAQVQLGGLSLPDSDQVPGTGDEVICTIEDVVSVMGSQIGKTVTYLRGEVKSGKAKIKADLSTQLPPGNCIPENPLVPGLSVKIYDIRVTCYEPDAAFAPVIDIPFVSDPTQGIHQPGGATRPASGLIATGGIDIE
jgi:hypothetical protein